ncbi:MAG: hypothetical protein HY066_14315 [Betaproteobacteria bacterium]|nr:hypothetical protein [Betaproteobacteria bacterium]
MSLRIVKPFKPFKLFIAAVLAAFSLAGCLNSGSSAPPPAAGLTLTPGDSQITVTWDMTPGVDYWLFYAPASSISPSNWSSVPGARAAISVTSPYALTGLFNGITYSVSLNGRIDGGPGGPGTPSVSAVPRLAGSVWSAGAPLGASNLHAATFGGSHIAAGLGGIMYTSSDGKSWTPLSAVTSKDLYAAKYVNGAYLAAGAGGTMLYSTDAKTWTAQSSATTNDLYAIASNYSTLNVAVGAHGTIITSSDGKTWSAAANSGSTSDLYGVTYSSGTSTWVAVGAGGTLLTSADGGTWKAVASGTSADLKSVAYFPTAGAGAFVAVGAAGTLVTSPDGITWTARPALTTSTLNAVIYGSQYVAVGANGTVLTSVDGITWLAQVSGTLSDLYAIEHAGYSYSAVGAGGANVYSQ